MFVAIKAKYRISLVKIKYIKDIKRRLIKFCQYKG